MARCTISTPGGEAGEHYRRRQKFDIPKGAWEAVLLAVGAVILLHGLTDAPDSQRHIARAYRDRSFVAVVIRLPAHGRETGDEGSRWTFGDMIAFILDLMRDRAGPSPAPP